MQELHETTRFSVALFTRRLDLVVLFVAICAMPARSLDFSSDLVLYEENFNGEVSFPITPEVDDIAAGGLIGFSESAGGFGAPPTLTGTAVHESVSASSTFAEGLIFLSNSIGTASFNLRGEFAGLSASLDTQAFIQLAANIDTGAINVGGIQTILLIQDDVMGGLKASINVVEADGTLPSGFNNFLEVPLAASETSALLAGAAFVLDCQIDRGAETVTGSIDISGFPSITVGPMSLFFVSPTDPVVGVGQQLTVNLPGGPTGTLVEVDFDTFRISRTQPTLVPLLSPSTVPLLVALLLGTAWWQTRRWRIDPQRAG